jgi:hypothetical protein
MTPVENNARFLVALLKGILVALVIVIFIAFTSELVRRRQYSKRWQVNRLTSALEADPRIQSIEIEGFDEGISLYEIESVSFSINGKPGSRISLLNPDLELKPPFSLLQIGTLRPFTRHSREASSHSFPLLGGSSSDRMDPGVDIRTIGDLITYYDEVHSYFSEWPVSPRSIEVECVGGRILFGSLSE